MSIAQTTTTSFKTELLQAVHNFGPTSANTFKIALYTAAASLDATTTVYTTANEVVGTGYTAGGNTLVISTTPTATNNNSGIPTAFISFADTSWAGAAFTARAALIYNTTQGNKSVAVLDFGSDKTVNGSSFTVQFPTATSNSAIVRIS
jgi:O-acetylhomoserine/O-acetylserine sulfhydrylase-like pyridoxal-dependent enzyme